MTASEALSSLEVVLGGICPAPKVLSVGRLLDLPVSADTFEKLLRHWAGLSEGSRPRLRGITVSREKPAQWQLLLDAGGGAPLLLFTVDSSWKSRSLKSLWPYAAWWESELASFESVSWADGPVMAEVEWRRV